MKKFLIPLLIVFMVSCQDSTQYSGHVYDENLQILADVKVQIVGTDIVTYTDENGLFRIDHKHRGNEILVIKPGFEMQFYTPGSQDEDIKLILKAEEGK